MPLILMVALTWRQSSGETVQSRNRLLLEQSDLGLQRLTNKGKSDRSL